MYFIETKATSRLPYFGHLPLNIYLSLVCIAAVATKLRGLNFIHFCIFVLSQKSKLWIILYLLMAVLAINTALKAARQNLQKYLPPPPPQSLMWTLKLAKVWTTTYCLGLYIIHYYSMVSLVRNRTCSGIISFFQSSTGLTGCRTGRHSGIYKYICTWTLTWTCSINMNMQNGHGHAELPWT